MTQMAQMTQMARIGRFVSVGAVGFGVQLAALQLFTAGLGLPQVVATAGAVELAVLHNFVWHERWTWVGRGTTAKEGRAGRLGRFHLTSGAVSITGNVVITSWVVAVSGAPLLLANALAVGACTVLNFVAADRLVFGRRVGVEG
jgi:putative flippase GtrA